MRHTGGIRSHNAFTFSEQNENHFDLNPKKGKEHFDNHSTLGHLVYTYIISLIMINLICIKPKIACQSISPFQGSIRFVWRCATLLVPAVIFWIWCLALFVCAVQNFWTQALYSPLVVLKWGCHTFDNEADFSRMPWGIREPGVSTIPCSTVGDHEWQLLKVGQYRFGVRWCFSLTTSDIDIVAFDDHGEGFGIMIRESVLDIERSISTKACV